MLTSNDHLRFEKKIVLSRSDVDNFYYWLRENGGHFYRPYPNRFINNIYFDSPSLEAFNENASGDSTRRKCRLRWYGEILNSNQFQFEVKCKDDSIGTKEIQKISNSLNVQDVSGLYRELRKSLNGRLKIFLDQSFRPTVFNRYEREYYENKDGVRLTIDKNLTHLYIRSRKIDYKMIEESDVYAVLELKYHQSIKDKVVNDFNSLPFVISKNSKYVNAVNLS